MSNDLVKHGDGTLSLTGRKARSTREEVAAILAPMFAQFPQQKVEAATIAVYVGMLLDIPADKLRPAVLHCMETCEFLPTVAHIRKAYQAATEPGPRNDLTPEQIAQRRDISRMRLYRDPDDTPAGRRERMRRTEKWSAKYGH